MGSNRGSRLAALLAMMALLVGCSAAPAGVTPATGSPAASSAASTASSATRSDAVASPAERTPRPTPVANPEQAPAGALVLAYEETAQVELIAADGRRVLIDVWSPDRLSRPPSADDILLTTHQHDDHYVPSFVDGFPGPKLTIEAGELRNDAFTITGIMGSHGEDPSSALPNVIFVIDVAGLRIVHLGDLGQLELTSDQLQAIGTPDVLISQLSNPYSSMNLANEKGFDYVRTLAPKVFVPTHMMDDTVGVVKQAASEWAAGYAPNRFVTLRPEILPAKTLVLFMGEEAHAYAKIADAEAIGW
jgi:L-ascorbate metabolism protein UlaG (beta-lactamase superfamily)